MGTHGRGRPAVTVKWGKQVFDAVELDTTQPPLQFRTQLFSLTGVPLERQKIMTKSGVLKVAAATRAGARGRLAGSHMARTHIALPDPMTHARARLSCARTTPTGPSSASKRHAGATTQAHTQSPSDAPAPLSTRPTSARLPVPALRRSVSWCAGRAP